MIDQPALGFFATYQVKVYDSQRNYLGVYKFRSIDGFTHSFYKDPEYSYVEMGYQQCSESEYEETLNGPVYEGQLLSTEIW